MQDQSVSLSIGIKREAPSGMPINDPPPVGKRSLTRGLGRDKKAERLHPTRTRIGFLQSARVDLYKSQLKIADIDSHD